MSNWFVTEPAGRKNYCRNPIFWSGVSTWQATWWHIDDISTYYADYTDDAYYGYRCANLKAPWMSGQVTMTSLYAPGGSIQVPYGSTVHFSAYAKALLSGSGIWLFIHDATHDADHFAYNSPLPTEWTRVVASWTNNVGVANVYFQVVSYQIATGSSLLVDAIQIEIGDEVSSFFCGDMEGCWWHGERNNSVSERSQYARSGGIQRDLKTTYGFGVTDIIDAAPKVTHHYQSFALSPGGSVAGSKVDESAFALAGVLKNRGTNKTLKQLRDELGDILKPWAYAKSGGIYQPVRLTYNDGVDDYYIDAHCENPGFSEATTVENVFGRYQKLSIEMLAPQPFWKAHRVKGYRGESHDETYIYSMGGFKGDGTLTDLGITAIVPSTTSNITDAVYSKVDGRVYFTGDFYEINGLDIVSLLIYDPLSDEVSGASNKEVFEYGSYGNCMTATSDGYILIGGRFYITGTSRAYVRMARYRIATDEFEGVDTGTWNLSADITDIAAETGSSAYIWIIGETIGSNNLRRFNHYDDSTWTNPPVDTIATAIHIDEQNVMWILGSFSGEPANNRLGKYNIETGDFETFETANDFSFPKNAIATSRSGKVYVAGQNGLYKESLWEFNGSRWKLLGTMVQKNDSFSIIKQIAVAPDGSVYVTGMFDQVLLNDGTYFETYVGMAVYRGGAWHRLPLNVIPTNVNTAFDALAIGRKDPIIENQFDVWFGFSNGTASRGYRTARVVSNQEINTITNAGNAPAYPTLWLERLATPVRLSRVANYTTGEIVEFDYDLASGEHVRIDFTPTGVKMTSLTHGRIADVVQAQSPSKTIHLAPGENRLAVYTYDTQTSAHNYEIVIISWQDGFSGV